MHSVSWQGHIRCLQAPWPFSQTRPLVQLTMRLRPARRLMPSFPLVAAARADTPLWTGIRWSYEIDCPAGCPSAAPEEGPAHRPPSGQAAHRSTCDGLRKATLAPCSPERVASCRNLGQAIDYHYTLSSDCDVAARPRLNPAGGSLPGGVMVTQGILVPSFKVRILAG